MDIYEQNHVLWILGNPGMTHYFTLYSIMKSDIMDHSWVSVVVICVCVFHGHFRIKSYIMGTYWNNCLHRDKKTEEYAAMI